MIISVSFVPNTEVKGHTNVRLVRQTFSFFFLTQPDPHPSFVAPQQTLFFFFEAAHMDDAKVIIEHYRSVTVTVLGSDYAVSFMRLH